MMRLLGIVDFYIWKKPNQTTPEEMDAVVEETRKSIKRNNDKMDEIIHRLNGENGWGRDI